jgi:hypothetical protein
MTYQVREVVLVTPSANKKAFYKARILEVRENTNVAKVERLDGHLLENPYIDIDYISAVDDPENERLRAKLEEDYESEIEACLDGADAINSSDDDE